jgi:phosphopantothenoylcysteine decarboxylase/phosphopantothenate--cysteine ligase
MKDGGANLLFVLSGSIACYKACDAISKLVQRGHRVRAVATPAALKFVGTATLEGLTREKVATDLFAEGGALDHIELTRWADLVIVCPATANTLNRIAAGMADDLAGSLLLAHDWKKPLLVAPAMNPAMWAHPATAASVARLRQWGVRFVDVGAGRTACGEVGEGRLAEPEEIVASVEAALAPPARRLRVLVTSGGTAEPIDAVRVITNTSTGGTGAMIAENFARGGHTVTLLRAASARAADGVAREETFVTFAELDAALARLLREESFDAVIHAAAVSDFSIASVEVDGVESAPGGAKLGSGSAPTLRLKTNPKLLDTLRPRSRNRAVRIVAFKLTNEASAADVRGAVEKLFTESAVDFVVHNDLASRDESGVFPAEVWGPRGDMIEYCADRRQIGAALEKLLTSEAGEASRSSRKDVANAAKV